MRKSYFFPGALLLLAAALLTGSSLPFKTPSALVMGIAAGILIALGLSNLKSKSDLAKGSERLQERDSFAGDRMFAATLSGMREGLIVVDQNMKVLASNPSAQRLFDSSFTVLEGKSLTEITRNPAIYDAFLDGLQGKERAGVKVEIFGPNRRVFDLRVVPLQSNQNQDAAGALGVFFDITRMEKLERVRQEFLSNVTHELRTPLTSVLAFVETLGSGDANESDTHRFLEIIRKNAVRMNRLIDDILELSAIEAGTIKVQPETIALAELVDDVFLTLAAKAGTRQIELINNVAADSTVYADASRLEQMVTNLVENAIKFNRTEGRVVVSYEANEHSRIRIEDTGEGIPKHHIERLFERFYRVDRARSRDLGGTGLGLSIVKHLAHLHGGDVSVESRLGEGSEFVIELPRGPEG